jgi:hypothetical protein
MRRRAREEPAFRVQRHTRCDHPQKIKRRLQAAEPGCLFLAGTPTPSIFELTSLSMQNLGNKGVASRFLVGRRSCLYYLCLGNDASNCGLCTRSDGTGLGCGKNIRSDFPSLAASSAGTSRTPPKRSSIGALSGMIRPAPLIREQIWKSDNTSFQVRNLFRWRFTAIQGRSDPPVRA